MKYLEEVRGFEPRKRLYIVYFFSREAPSTARPHFHKMRAAPLRTFRTRNLPRTIPFSPLTQKVIEKHKNIGVLGGTYFIPNSLTELAWASAFNQTCCHLYGAFFIPPCHVAAYLESIVGKESIRKPLRRYSPRRAFAIHSGFINVSAGVLDTPAAFYVFTLFGQTSSRLCFTSHFASVLGLTASYTKRFLLL